MRDALSEMREALSDLSAANGGVFTRAQAMAAGYTERQVRLLVDAGLWASLRHGILVDGEQLALANDQSRAVLDIAAARLTLAIPTVGGDRSAASAHGLPLLTGSRATFLVGARSLRRGTMKLPVLVRRAALPPGHCVDVNGVPITSVARTVTDLSVAMPRLDAIVAIDAALHRGLVTIDELITISAEAGTLPSLMQLLAECDGRSESPLESISRIILAEQGIEAPELQQEIRGRDGRLIGRVDFWWGGFRTIGEADGLVKYDSPEKLHEEKLRQERLEQADCRVVRWTWDEITKTPWEVAARLRTAFAASPR
jgi:hypothetical protein